ncbi:TetR family transcriptional regulator [Nocardioides sp. MAH-18]|uniref:TetR family transcriptional regulator n=1 Tax=Nocardioides agri TaxID=2682843 RepID=A0A6L6XUT0_9ACTN|nr:MULTISPECIES: TetR/AcrR family transcriptional regulator [unclassified Nocardioides]MBA2956291.1 TetR family transcriptional regulator [Nocardioides sp. CGMCC 1.13656]MVQ51134.1 TetR family transcriptional regulator [Nocardioides sp. MAH-18]
MPDPRAPVVTDQPHATAPLSPRRRQLLEAAQHVIADEGLKGLTHRAVDRRAGLPEGSCSAYWRTRQALQAALASYVSDALLTDVDELAARMQAASPDEATTVGAAVDLFLQWLDQRELLIARLELTLAASRDADLRALLVDHRARLVTIVDQIMCAAGKEQGGLSAEALVASYDGVLLAALLRPPADRRSFLEQSMALLGESLSSAPVA